MSYSLTKMAYGDIRLITFLWNKWLLAGDALTGTPVIASTLPVMDATLLGVSGSAVTIIVTAGNYAGTGQVSCEVETVNGEQATRTVYIPVAPLVP